MSDSASTPIWAAQTTWPRREVVGEAADLGIDAGAPAAVFEAA